MTVERDPKRRSSADAAPELPADLRLLFTPLNKRAFGIAVAAVCALAVGAATLFHVIVKPGSAPDISLLGAYFPGYTVTFAGVFIGAAWASVVGFACGWLVAFCRNLVIAASMFLTRTKAELRATRDFLDHM